MVLLANNITESLGGRTHAYQHYTQRNAITTRVQNHFNLENTTMPFSFVLHRISGIIRFADIAGKTGRFRDIRPQRVFKHVPLWNLTVELIYSPRRVTCHDCGGIYVEHMPWAAGKRRMTTAYACFLATWARMLPWKQVAELFNCSWGTVCSAVHHVVDYGLQNRDLSDLTVIGIDEISRKRGHQYLTNVYDLKTSTLIWSAPGRSKDTLTEFFQFIGPQGASG
jgi:transposase